MTYLHICVVLVRTENFFYMAKDNGGSKEIISRIEVLMVKNSGLFMVHLLLTIFITIVTKQIIYVSLFYSDIYIEMTQTLIKFHYLFFSCRSFCWIFINDRKIWTHLCPNCLVNCMSPTLILVLHLYHFNSHFPFSKVYVKVLHIDKIIWWVRHRL